MIESCRANQESNFSTRRSQRYAKESNDGIKTQRSPSLRLSPTRGERVLKHFRTKHLPLPSWERAGERGLLSMSHIAVSLSHGLLNYNATLVEVSLMVPVSFAYLCGLCVDTLCMSSSRIQIEASAVESSLEDS